MEPVDPTWTFFLPDGGAPNLIFWTQTGAWFNPTTSTVEAASYNAWVDAGNTAPAWP